MTDQTLIDAILDAADYAEQHGVKALSRRDRREPERRAKEIGELRLSALLARMLRKQARIVQDRLERNYPDRKALDLGDDWEMWLNDALDDDDLADLVQELARLYLSGVSLFGAAAPLIDYSLFNPKAAAWARAYAYDLIRAVNATTVAALRQAIATFIATPGFTLRDVMDVLPYSEQRAQMIAVTETTRAFARGQVEAGQELRREFPGVRVVKRWYTNVDDRVCEVCAPLGETGEIELDEKFQGLSGEIDGPPAHPNCRCWISTSTAVRT